MDKSEAKRIVEANHVPYRSAMRIGHWTGVISFGQCESPNETALAECNRKLEYEQYCITINHELIDDESTLLMALRHELFHVVLSPMDLFRDIAVPEMHDDNEEARLRIVRTAWRHSLEQQVCNLERLWAGTEEYHLEIATRP